jgi:periplasmic protein TonB
MFESLALEDPRDTRRRWTTAASFVLEALGVGLLILAPLGYTEAISLKIDKPLEAPVGRAMPLETHARPDRPTPSRPQTQIRDGMLVFTGIPRITRPIVDPLSEPSSPEPGPYVPYATGEPGKGSAIDQFLALNHKPEVVGPSVESRRRVPISRLDPGMLIKQVQPIYPKIAVDTRTEGTVLLAAVIDTQGRITQLRALGGHPFLIPAAISAVQQWRYRPYILNGQAVEVETQVSVVFTLQH